jgi:hypothetical protein
MPNAVLLSGLYEVLAEVPMAIPMGVIWTDQQSKLFCDLPLLFSVDQKREQGHSNGMLTKR